MFFLKKTNIFFYNFLFFHNRKCSVVIRVGNLACLQCSLEPSISTVEATSIDACRLARVDAVRHVNRAEFRVFQRGREALCAVARRHDCRLL